MFVRLAVLVVLAMSIAPLGAQESMTVKGVLVDASCVQKEGAGKVLSPEHLACAKDCFSNGHQVGIFDDDLGLVKLVGDFPIKNSAKIVDLFGKTVQAKGVRARGGDYAPLLEVQSLVAAPPRPAK